MNLEDIITECAFLNKFANDIRYPHKYRVNESDASYSIRIVVKIRSFEPINYLRDIINEEL